MNKTTIEQWRSLLAIAKAGTYAGAAEALHKTPSSIHHSINQLRDRLGVELLEVQGKKTSLTDKGQALLRRADRLVREFSDLEALAGDFANGWEAEISLAVESIFPAPWLMNILLEFSVQGRATRLQVYESVLSRTDDLLLRQQVDLSMTPRVPAGFIGEHLVSVELVAVAHAEHELHQLGDNITAQELAAYRQFIVRDEGSNPLDAGWQAAERRWTVSDFARSLDCVRAGLGFGRFPRPLIEDELQSGHLKLLNLREGSTTPVPIFLVFADAERAGPGVQTLAACIRQSVQLHGRQVER